MPTAKPKQEETIFLTMSDLHYGKKTSSFNPESFKAKLDDIGDRLAKIRDLYSAGYNFDELVVCLLGDVNDGTGIYATQAFHQAQQNVEEQADELSDILTPWFKKQQKIWGKVRIETVPGNHGRTGKFGHEAANWDIVTYKYLKLKLGKDVPVKIGKADELFVRKIQVRGHNYLLYHGHDIRTFGNIAWYGIQLRVARWNTTKALSPFDVVMMGHFHTFGSWTFNKITALLSGTMVTHDSWALQTLGWESANKWWLFGASKNRPITWTIGLDV